MAVKLRAERRDDLTKSHTNQLRKKGFIPSVVYGNDKEAITVAVENIELLKTLRDEGRNAVITLDIEQGESVEVMLHEYQMDPLRDEVIHADFYVVDMSQEMDVTVSIQLEGEPAGVREGGILQQPLYELQVRATPANIPDQITINVADLEIGDAISVSDLDKAEGYEVTEAPDTTIVTITAPQAEEALEPSEDGEFVEPELVDQKGDTEETE
ncbi:50S ribosomal protein L25/general stress protein Ctc [Amphibacillus indicireducens]|uniref:Large ribosomal subunit protein bL25 n=1 Tax=Amphibacillus indicireducens TaxID=1076330 RepID=A0ABP7VYT2_9BACI